MTDYKAKHRELYLEELKEILKNHNSGTNAGMEKLTLSRIFYLINNFNLNDMTEVTSILKLLRDNLSYDDFKFVCTYEFGDYSTNSLQKITYKLFKDQFIDIILESRYMRWKINLKIGWITNLLRGR